MGRCMISGFPIRDGDIVHEIYAPINGRLHRCRADYREGDIPMWALLQAVERSDSVAHINSVLTDRERLVQFGAALEKKPEAKELFRLECNHRLHLITCAELVKHSGLLWRVGRFSYNRLSDYAYAHVWRRGYVHVEVAGWFAEHGTSTKQPLWAFARQFSDEQALEFLGEFPAVCDYLRCCSGLRGLLIDATRLGYSLHLYSGDYMLVGQQATTREEWAFRGDYFQHLAHLAKRFEQSTEEES